MHEGAKMRGKFRFRCDDGMMRCNAMLKDDGGVSFAEMVGFNWRWVAESRGKNKVPRLVGFWWGVRLKLLH